MKDQDNNLPEELRIILSKYYDGLSTIEEENLLRKYFDKHVIPDSLIADKTILSFNNQDKNPTFNSNSEIWDAINKKGETQKHFRRTIRYAVSAAAVLIILISIGLSFYFTSGERSRLATDTYSNPEEAYKAVQKYLGFTSKKLSYAYTEMKPIEMLSVPSNAIRPFSEIDKNLNRLNELQRINSASKRLANFSIFSNYIDVNDKN